MDVSNIMLSSYIVIGKDKNSKEHLIARWSATPLVPYTVLVEEAPLLVKKKIESKIRAALKEKERDLEELDTLVEKYLKGDYISYWLR